MVADGSLEMEEILLMNLKPLFALFGFYQNLRGEVMARGLEGRSHWVKAMERHGGSMNSPVLWLPQWPAEQIELHTAGLSWECPS